MANLGTLVVNLTANTGDYNKGMSKAAKITQSTTKKIQTIGKIAGGVALAGVTALGVGVFAFARKAIPAASDVVESMNAVNKVFGESDDVILDWGEQAATQAGLAQSEFFQMSAQTGAMLQNLGIAQADAAEESVNLAKRAADMASIFNTDVSEALGAIQAGLRGEADPLERFGVRLSAAAVKAKALEMNLLGASGEMDDQARAAAALALLYEQTDSLAGDFVETSGDLANAQRVAAAQFENFMAKIGKLALPILGRVFGYISKTVLPILNDFATFIIHVFEEGEILGEYLEALPEWLQPIAVTIANVIGAFQDFFGFLQEGQDPLGSIVRLIYDLALAFGVTDDEAFNIANTFYNTITALTDFKDRVMEFLQPIIDWISRTVEWKDVLIVLGIAILSVVIPAVLSLLATILPIILIFGVLVIAVALLRKAWENDWGGIRTKLLAIWDQIKPKLEALWAWLQENIPKAIETLKGFWENTLLPALQNFWDWVSENIFPLFETLWAWLQETIPAAIETLRGFWEETLLPAIESVWKFLSEDMMPIWIALADLFDATVGTAITILTGLWENTLLPALEDVWEWIQDKILPIFTDLSESAGGVSGVIERVAGWINSLADSIRNLPNYLPAWITGQSPSPFEVSLRGVADAMEELTRKQLPAFTAEVAMSAVGPGPGMTVGAGMSNPMVVYGGLHLHGVEDKESLLEELRDLSP